MDVGHTRKLNANLQNMPPANGIVTVADEFDEFDEFDDGLLAAALDDFEIKLEAKDTQKKIKVNLTNRA